MKFLKILFLFGVMLSCSFSSCSNQDAIDLRWNIAEGQTLVYDLQMEEVDSSYFNSNALFTSDSEKDEEEGDFFDDIIKDIQQQLKNTRFQLLGKSDGKSDYEVVMQG